MFSGRAKSRGAPDRPIRSPRLFALISLFSLKVAARRRDLLFSAFKSAQLSFLYTVSSTSAPLMLTFTSSATLASTDFSSSSHAWRVASV